MFFVTAVANFAANNRLEKGGSAWSCLYKTEHCDHINPFSQNYLVYVGVVSFYRH